jgi:hypothetical protein
LGLVGRSIPQGVQFEPSARSSGSVQKEPLYRVPNREPVDPAKQYNEPRINIQANKFDRPNWSFVIKWSAASFFGAGISFLATAFISNLSFFNSLNNSSLNPLSGSPQLPTIPYMMIVLGLGIATFQWFILRLELSSRIWFVTNSLSIGVAFLLLNLIAPNHTSGGNSNTGVFYFDGNLTTAYIGWSIGAAIFLIGIYTFLRNIFHKAWWYIIIPIATALSGNIIDFALYKLIYQQHSIFEMIAVFVFSILFLWIVKPSLIKKTNRKKYIIFGAGFLVFLLAETAFNYYRYSQSLSDRANYISPFISSITVIASCVSSGLVMDWLVRTQKKVESD